MIEKNIKNLFDHITRLDSGGRGDTEEDAMFTKKPFGPVNCASCEKDVVNLQGIKADFLAWKRLPERNPGDRIARVSIVSLVLFVVVRARILQDAEHDQVN